MRCIYCFQEKPRAAFAKREHVLPQSFGRFSPGNLVLRDCVCDECNQFFGDKIELFLGRDTFEGTLERLRQGMKPKAPLERSRRVKSKIRAGRWKNVIVVEWPLESGRIGLKKTIQAGFYHNEKQEYDFFESADIPTAEELIERGYAVKGKMVWLIAEEVEELNALKDHLKSRGINLQNKIDVVEHSQHGETVPVVTEITIDRPVMQGMCKIAFNYLAYTAGKQLALSNDFDGIRRFIRYGEGNSEDFFEVNATPILNDGQQLERFGIKITEGYLIILGWRGNNLVSKVSLFNTNTYGIALCNGFGGVWRPIQSGHHFDVENKQVHKLISITKKLLI